MFRALVLARIIESSSKLDSIRVLEEAGLSAPSYRTITRRLPGYAKDEFRQRVSAACAARAGLGPASLVLYDVSTLYAYHRLFQIEKSFRMPKHDLQARPIFHHKRESIQSHLTVVFAALAISKFIEAEPVGALRDSCGPRAATAPSISKPASTPSPPQTRYPKTSPRHSGLSVDRADLRTSFGPSQVKSGKDLRRCQTDGLHERRCRHGAVLTIDGLAAS